LTLGLLAVVDSTLRGQKTEKLGSKSESELVAEYKMKKMKNLKGMMTNLQKSMKK